jgi:hypothetical protein
VNPIPIISMFLRLCTVIQTASHPMKICPSTLVTIVHSPRRVLRIAAYVCIANLYLCAYLKMNQYPLDTTILTITTMPVPTTYPTFYSVVLKDDHRRPYKLLNNSHASIPRRFPDYWRRHQRIKINFDSFAGWARHCIRQQRVAWPCPYQLHRVYHRFDTHWMFHQ